MIPRAVGTNVRFSLTMQDPVAYLRPAAELIAAQESLAANQTELARVELQPFRERVLAAEDDLEHLLSDTVDIKHAEMVLRMLFKAINDAKVARGDFNRGDDA